jgi:hypothetical protein
MENTTENLDDEKRTKVQSGIRDSNCCPDADRPDRAIGSTVDAQLRLLRLLARLVVDDLRKITN